jgi:hypothetical protein
MPDSLYVFDNESSYLKKCLAKVEMTNFPNLCQSSRTKVVKQLQWRMPKVGSVSASTYTGAAIPNAPYATNFIYNSMPSNTSAFGNTNVWLEFTQKTNWCWRADAQFRFNRTNNGASSFVNMPNTVSAGNPNWYVYWQQVATQFSGSAGGSFGPQATYMFYDSANQGPNNTGAYHLSIDWVPYTDKIVIYDCNKSGIFDYVETIHHENGHHQCLELPANQGGWGSNISYNYAQDIDSDYINDAWEAPGGTGAALGFTIDRTPVVNTNNQTWRSNWNHGWTNATPGSDCITNAPFSFSPYCNPNGYNQATGSGLCPRNEAEVELERTQIKAKDWSYKP